MAHSVVRTAWIWIWVQGAFSHIQPAYSAGKQDMENEQSYLISPWCQLQDNDAMMTNG